MRTSTITIFHTNDIHSGFHNWAKIVSHIKKERTALSRYVDLGDHADRANPITEATAGQGNMQLLNAAEVDFITIGNNEGVTFSKEMLEQMYNQATAKVIVANLFSAENGKRPEWALPYWIDEMENGLTIGYLGFTSPMIHFYDQLGWDVSFTVELVEEQVRQLKGKVDALILLSHLGLPKDERVAEQVEGITAIIGAHTHHVLPSGKRVNDTLIVQAGKHGHYLGRLTITFHDKKVREVKDTLLDPVYFDEDESTKALLATLTDQAEMALEQPFTTLIRSFDVKWFEHSEAAQALCDALTEWCGLEIGMMNAGVLLESLPSGSVTYGRIHQICPHPINPCIVELTGKELKESIERAQTDEMVKLELKGFGFRGKVLGLMLFTGIEQTLDGIFIKGTRLDEARVYKLATLDMYTFGFLFPHMVHAKKQYLLPEFLRDILAQLLQAGTHHYSFS